MTTAFKNLESVRDFFANEIKQNVVRFPDGFPDSFYDETGELYHTTTIDVVNKIKPLIEKLSEITGDDIELILNDWYDWFETTSFDARETVKGAIWGGKNGQNALDQFINEWVTLSTFNEFAQLF